MAEAKNSFIKSKMNKDLDERLIPNNEYRDALNVEKTFTGDTLCPEDNPIVLEAITFPQPVISVAVEPKSGDRPSANHKI